MYLVRSRGGDTSWAEWNKAWGDVISAVSERVADRKANHPGFDVIMVTIEKHVVVRAGVAIEDGATAGWNDRTSEPS